MSLLFFEQIIEWIKKKNKKQEYRLRGFKEFKSNYYIWFECLRKIHRTEKRRKTISYIVGVVECFLTDEMITMMGDGKPH